MMVESQFFVWEECEKCFAQESLYNVIGMTTWSIIVSWHAIAASQRSTTESGRNAEKLFDMETIHVVALLVLRGRV